MKEKSALENANFGKLSISRSKALIFIVYSLIALLYISGLYQKLHVSADDRIKFHAIPVAISTLYQGHKHDYRGWRSTEIPFQNDVLLTDEFIAQHIQAPVNKAQGHYYWVADDRGFADYVIAAFALFGPRMKSLYHFWFVILLLSATLFVLAFNRQVWAMAFLALLVLGIHSAVALLKLTPNLTALYEPRYLDVLALVPVYHMIFAAVCLKKEDLKGNLPYLLGQLLIFIFLYHARSSLGWEIVAVIGISLFTFVKNKEWTKITPSLLVIVLLLSGSLALTSYKHIKYHKSYFQDSAYGVRTFWHNALMGLNIKALPTYLVDDFTIAQIVTQYANDSKSWATSVGNLTAQELLNTLGNWGKADWIAYESCAKELYFSLLRENKREVIRMYLFDKPLQTLIDLSSPKGGLYSGKTPLPPPKNALPWNPLHFLYLIPFSCIALLSAQSLYLSRWKLLSITFAVFITGMIPSIAFYSKILTRGGLSVTMAIGLYLGIAICAFSVYKWIEKLIHTRRLKTYGT